MKFGFLATMLAGIGVCPAAVQPAAQRKAAADFTLQDSRGATVKLSDLKGKVVLLNFWATWCGPCKLEIPWFMDFQKLYQNQGFTVVGVSMDDEGWKVVRPYLAAAKMNYPVVLGNDKVADSFGGVDAMPTTLVIDREGRVAAVHTGLVGKDKYRQEILSLLGKSR